MAARFSAAGAGDGQLGACPRVIVRWPEAFACGAPLGATAAAAALGNKLYVLGGLDELGHTVTTVERYDTEKDVRSGDGRPEG